MRQNYPCEHYGPVWLGGAHIKRVEFDKLKDSKEAPSVKTLDSIPFTGEAILLGENDRKELRTFIEGLEDGPVLIWNPSGKLVAQGNRHYLFGPVGPWHEWDEQGRLLRETIYDALGNRIIHRELDENLNIVKQERFAPTTLMTDPETGEQYPAPWL